MEIGEAVKDVDSNLLAQQPAIPWRRIAATRDQLAHRYFDTSHAIVAGTVTNDLVELRVAVEGLINSLQRAPQAEKSGHAGLPETDLARVRRWCRDRVPDHLRDQVRVEVDVDARHLTVLECRPPWDGQGDWTRLPVARLRFTKATGLWTLYWRDRNERFHLYDRISAGESLQVLLVEIDQDPTAIFWG